ncbi:hypothetical protein JCM11641_004701 [Rhodosporidiobolus odoratus]
MRSVLALATLAVVAVNAAPAPFSSLEHMKREIIQRMDSNKLNKRQSVTTGADDVTILNFALTLEHLEAKFYADAISRFNASAFESAGFPGVYDVVKQVGADEQAHVEFLTTALSAAGATPVEACNYTFPGAEDVSGFLALSQVIENVGVSAYLGAAGSINNTDYLTAAGSVLTVEARHAAAIQFIHGYQPASQPMDTPLSASNIVTIVSPFFTSCPSGSAPTITGNTALNVTTTAPAINSTLELVPANSSAIEGQEAVYCGFASGLSSAFSNYTNGACDIPSQNITAGQTYVLLTSGPSLLADSILAGPAILSLDVANLTVGPFVGAMASSTSNSISSSASSTMLSSASSSVATGVSSISSAVSSAYASATASSV